MNPGPFDEHGLDRWLAAGMAALHAAVEDALDLGAGLADIRLPEVDDRLVETLGGVLDLDAGLAAILPVAARPPTTTAPTGDRASGMALRGFADRLAARPPHERLLARTWLPRPELAAARSFTRLRSAVREFDHDLARTRDIALTERIEDRLAERGSAGDLVHVRADLRDRARELHRGRELGDVIDQAVLSALDLGFALDLDRVRDGAHDLARGLALALAVERALHLALTIALEITHCRAWASIDARVRGLRTLLADIDRDAREAGCGAHLGTDDLRDGDFVDALVRRLNVVRAEVRDVVLDRDRDLAAVLAEVLGQARDLALDQAHGRAEASDDESARDLADALGHGPRPHDDRSDTDLVDAVDRIEHAVTDVVDADLAHVPLHGIPLEGLRWSSRTKWHPAWQDRVRRDSVELTPGRYEIRGGRVDAAGVATDITP